MPDETYELPGVISAKSPCMVCVLTEPLVVTRRLTDAPATLPMLAMTHPPLLLGEPLATAPAKEKVVTSPQNTGGEGGDGSGGDGGGGGGARGGGDGGASGGGGGGSEGGGGGARDGSGGGVEGGREGGGERGGGELGGDGRASGGVEGSGGGCDGGELGDGGVGLLCDGSGGGGGVNGGGGLGGGLQPTLWQTYDLSNEQGASFHDPSARNSKQSSPPLPTLLGSPARQFVYESGALDGLHTHVPSDAASVPPIHTVELLLTAARSSAFCAADCTLASSCPAARQEASASAHERGASFMST